MLQTIKLYADGNELHNLVIQCYSKQQLFHFHNERCHYTLSLFSAIASVYSMHSYRRTVETSIEPNRREGNPSLIIATCTQPIVHSILMGIFHIFEQFLVTNCLSNQAFTIASSFLLNSSFSS